jgi:hypothetical protein
VRRFVVIATLDGPLPVPVPLDDAGQIAAMVSEGQERQADARIVWLAEKDKRDEARLRRAYGQRQVVRSLRDGEARMRRTG